MTEFARTPCCIPFCPYEVYARVGESAMCPSHSNAVFHATALAMEDEARLIMAAHKDGREADCRRHQSLFLDGVLEAILCQLSPGLHGNEWRARLRAAQKRREMLAA